MASNTNQMQPKPYSEPNDDKDFSDMHLKKLPCYTYCSGVCVQRPKISHFGIQGVHPDTNMDGVLPRTTHRMDTKRACKMMDGHVN